MNLTQTKLKQITDIAFISAIYFVISLVFMPFIFGAVQIRISEALTIMPIFKKRYIYGLTLGCFLTNLIGVFTGNNILGIIDSIIGSLATLISGLLTYKFKDYNIKGLPILSTLFPVIINAFVVGGELTILMKGTLFSDLFFINSLSVGIGQFISCSLVGLILYFTLKSTIFAKNISGI